MPAEYHIIGTDATDSMLASSMELIRKLLTFTKAPAKFLSVDGPAVEVTGYQASSISR